MLKISKDKIYDLFSAVAGKQALYIPVDREAGAAEFRRYEDGAKLSECLNTVRSAKDFFFPQTENLVDFKMEGKKIEIVDRIRGIIALIGKKQAESRRID